MKRIESNEYFNAVKMYFADNREPARVIGSFWEHCERKIMKYLMICFTLALTT